MQFLFALRDLKMHDISNGSPAACPRNSCPASRRTNHSKAAAPASPAAQGSWLLCLFVGLPSHSLSSVHRLSAAGCSGGTSLLCHPCAVSTHLRGDYRPSLRTPPQPAPRQPPPGGIWGLGLRHLLRGKWVSQSEATIICTAGIEHLHKLQLEGKT